MRKPKRVLVAPIIAAALLAACVSFALATGHQTVPPATSGVYPCVPSHTGSHGGDYGSWQTWWQWLKNRYGTKWADELRAKYGSGLERYIESKYAGSSATSTFYGGGQGGGGNDDCDPEKPGCGPDKNGGYAGGSGYHDGQPPKSDGRGDCPDVCKTSATGQGNQGGASGGSANHGKCDPPEPSTGGCGGCKASSITLTGSVDPNGNATQYKFEYGTTPAFGMETGWSSAGDGTSARSVSDSVDGLAAGTKIYYRLVAKSVRGTNYGPTRYCSTVAAQKPSATTGNAGSVAKTTAAVTGTVNPNGAATSVYFQYGKSSSSLGSQTGSQSAGNGDDHKSLSTGLSGLSANTKYYYRVVATNAKGTTSGSLLSFTTTR